MGRRLAFAVAASLVFIGLLVVSKAVLRCRGFPTHPTQLVNEWQSTSQSAIQPLPAGSSYQSNEPLDAISNADRSSAGAKSDPPWKSYSSAAYGFEIKYPADWEFDASNYEDNYGKPPSGHGRPAYAGETRTLFDLELDGPDQPQEGGGDFEDGAIIEAQITGTSGVIESWNITRDRPPRQYIQTSTPTEWVKVHSAVFSGEHVESVAINTNGFKGAIQVACNITDPCNVTGETGGAFRLLPSGRVLLFSWERAAYPIHGHESNDFSYQKYFLPMLSSLRMLR